MDKFLSDSEGILSDKKFMSRLSERLGSASLKSRWNAPIKSRIKQSFKNNLYNPEELADFTGDKGFGDSKRVKADELTLADFESGGEFFDDSALSEDDLTLESADFAEEFFGSDSPADSLELPKTLRDFQKELLTTADQIVEDVMRELSPKAEKMLKNGDFIQASTAMPAENASAAPPSAAFGASPPQGAKIPPLFSKEMYDNSCKLVDKLAL
jgi:hypothetical protein